MSLALSLLIKTKKLLRQYLGKLKHQKAALFGVLELGIALVIVKKLYFFLSWYVGHLRCRYSKVHIFSEIRDVA